MNYKELVLSVYPDAVAYGIDNFHIYNGEEYLDGICAINENDAWYNAWCMIERTTLQKLAL
jgi:hypothetical protein